MAVEAIISINAIRHSVIPPTINTLEIEAEYGDKFSFALGISEMQKVNLAFSNTFGFGGHMANVLFKKY